MIYIYIPLSHHVFIKKIIEPHDGIVVPYIFYDDAHLDDGRLIHGNVGKTCFFEPSRF